MGIFGKKIRWVRTCVQCGFNNPEDATMCNKCRTKFLDSGFFGSSYNSNSYLRWLCNTCGTLNNAGNNTCAGCFKKKQFFYSKQIQAENKSAIFALSMKLTLLPIET